MDTPLFGYYPFIKKYPEDKIDYYDEDPSFEDLYYTPNYELSADLNRDFDLTKNIIEKQIVTSDNTDTILAIPDIAQSMGQYEEDPDKRYAWRLLSDMMRTWICSSAQSSNHNNRRFLPVINISSQWIFSHKIAEDALKELLSRNILFNYKAKEELKSILQRNGVWQRGGYFKFSDLKNHEFENWYFQRQSVSPVTLFDSTPLNGLTIALDTFSLKALPKGFVSVAKNGERKVRIDGIDVYAYDTFNFDESNGSRFIPDFISNNLGYWSKNFKSFSPFPISCLYSDYIRLGNSDFNNFRRNYKKGGDFQVISDLRKLLFKKSEELTLK